MFVEKNWGYNKNKIETNTLQKGNLNNSLIYTKMVRDTKSKKEQTKKKVAAKKEEQKKRMTTRGKPDDDSEEEEEEDDEEEEEDMDPIEYRKFLSSLFPSKNAEKKVKDGEKLKKTLAKDLKKNKKVIESEDEEEVWETEEEEEEDTKKKKKKNGKKKKVVVEESDDPDDSDYVPTEEDDGDDEEEESDDDDGRKKKGEDVTIYFTIGGDDDDDYDDDDEDDEETEDEDASVSSDDDDDDSEDEDSDDTASILDEELIKRKNKGKQPPTPRIVKKKSTTEQIVKDEDVISKLKEIQEKDKDNKMIQQCISVCEKNIKENNKKMEKKNKKQKDKNMRIFKKIIKDKNTNNDFSFYDKLDMEKQKTIIKELREINKITRVEKPYRMTLLESNIPVQFKSAAMKKINSIRHMDPGSGEYYKNKNWIDNFMRIPFGKYDKLPVSIEDGVEKCHEFMEGAAKILSEAVYGLDDAKMQILQMTGQLITNPKSIGCAIGIYGPPGTGKTSLIKDGIAKILGRKTVLIPLGGAKDSSHLNGHGFTYEGSTWGKIVQGLIDSQSSSVVFVFDEVDKLSQTTHGEEITGVLTHLIDSTQNDEFHDNYFAEVKFDLSKCLFVFSYNDESLVNPILRDRMYRIRTEGYDEKQKTVISKQYLMPKIREQVKFGEGDIIIPEDSIHHMIDKYCEKEDGVRNLKRCLEIIHTKLNLYRLMRPGSNLFEKEMSLKVEFPFKVTPDIVDKLIKKNDKTKSTFQSMYM